MNILILGSRGFIAKNLIISLKKNPKFLLFEVNNKKQNNKIYSLLDNADVVFHLAGVNKGSSKKYFFDNNSVFTKKICEYIEKKKLNLKFFYTSTIHTNKNNFYGQSKKMAEDSVLALKKNTQCSVFIYKLPNIFGKGCRPFYNSVIATFCYQIARGKRIVVKNPKEKLNFLYVEDLIASFQKNIFIRKQKKGKFSQLPKSHSISVGKLHSMLVGFGANSDFSVLHKQKGFLKKLYSVYLSYFPARKIVNFKEGFRNLTGSFYEILKSKDVGQVSYLSIKPGATRGNHYHNTKVELFFLVCGHVKFTIENIFGQKKTIFTLKSGKKIPNIVTQPGFAHNIINIGKIEAKFIIWSNEIFNAKIPDTHVYKIDK